MFVLIINDISINKKPYKSSERPKYPLQLYSLRHSMEYRKK